MRPNEKWGIEFTETTAGANCPVCQTEMHVGFVAGAKAVFCRSCQGGLFDGETFAALVKMLRSEYRGPEKTPRPLDPERPKESRDCPSCFQPMENHPYSGPGNVIVDACPECYLTWLDRDELTRIVEGSGRR